MSENINEIIFTEIFNRCLHPEYKKISNAWFECLSCKTRNWFERKPDIPNYSGSISDAWKVVDEMKAQGFILKLESGADICRAEFATVDMEIGGLSGIHEDSEAMAICVAALSAKGIQV